MRISQLLLVTSLSLASFSSFATSQPHLIKEGRALPVVSKEMRAASGDAKTAQPLHKATLVNGGITLHRRAVESKVREKVQTSQKPDRPKRSTAPVMSQKSGDFTIFDSWVTLDYDDDSDGYYSELTVGFDVDTVYSVADVFADIYVSENGGPWELLDTTSVFTIHGAENDGWEVSYTLNSGYPTNSYDILIDVYEDGFSGIVDTASPDTDNDLFDLPLEDKEHELFANPVAIPFVSTDLYADNDGDGFYTQMTLEYDIDSTLAGDLVYAEIVITSTIDGARQIINTEEFVLDSHTEIIDLSFDTGYLPGWFNIQINLVNSYTGETFGSAGTEFIALRELPLESKNNDNFYDDPNAVDTVIIVEEGGGSLAWILLPALAGIGIRRRMTKGVPPVRG